MAVRLIILCISEHTSDFVRISLKCMAYWLYFISMIRVFSFSAWKEQGFLWILAALVDEFSSLRALSGNRPFLSVSGRWKVIRETHTNTVELFSLPLALMV